MRNEEGIDDNEVIALILRGERDRYRVLVDRYRSAVYAMLMRQLRDPVAAEELAQETFVRAFYGLSGYRQDAKFSTWLTRIALNVAHSYFASRQYRERRRSNTLDMDRLHAESTDPAKALQKNEETMRLREALARLKPKYREVVVLCAFESKTYSEAAETLGVPTGTVCSRMNTALNQLRKEMKRER